MKTPTRPRTAELRDYRDHVPYLLGAIANILSSGGARLYQEAFGISLAEWRLMWVLRRETPLTAVRAAEIMGVDKGAVSRALSGLERRGLATVTAHPTDRRQRTIWLSEAGVALHGQVNLVAQERERQLFSAFTAEELHMLRQLLRRLHAHAPSIDAIDIEKFTQRKLGQAKAASRPRPRSTPTDKSVAR
jgi:DNA-binding MarR family transcriptional regulator